MRVYGLDFTSNPTRSKRLTLADCDLDGDVLVVQHLHPLQSKKAGDFTSFESWLSGSGEWTTNEEWVAGLDFPFGMAIEAIEHFGWCPTGSSTPSWEEYLGVLFQTKSQREFRELIEGWRHTSRKNDKGDFVRVRRSRLTDKLASSGTPMNFYPPVVCPMFFQGAKRLLDFATGVSIVPVRPIAESTKQIVEAYPRLVSNTVIRSQDSYKEKSSKKHKDKNQQSVIRQQDEHARENRRKSIIQAFSDGAVQEQYGFEITLSEDLKNECVEDIDGDKIDSVLCAIQAAWACRHPNKGMPEFGLHVLRDRVRLEGWIADPYVLQRFQDGDG
jgi:hypothetical protein